MPGYNGKILRVNLTSGAITIEEPSENFYRTYFGGEAFISYTLLKEVAKGVDPLGPENKLVFAAGILTGLPVGGCGRHAVGAKSPLTGGIGFSEAGGYWGAELKMAGFDAIIFEGKSPKPVYLSVTDGKAELRDAGKLWGMKALECQDAIRAELGDNLVKVALIGPGGENMVRYACISNDIDAFAGRSGMGAVMGSKNLKAVACRGHQRVAVASPEKVAEIGKWVRDNTPVFAKGLRDLGTPRLTEMLNMDGGLPTRNFQLGQFENVDAISGKTINEYLVRRKACFACPVQCKREIKIGNLDQRYSGQEYETIAAFGSCCGVSDLVTVCKAHELTSAYGVDSISCGASISFAMECVENGILTPADMDGIDLRFGNGEAMLKMIEMIALRKGFGDLLAEGSLRAAKKIGKGSEAYAMQVKGQEFPMHEPRYKPALGMGFAMSPTGADHCHNMHDGLVAAKTPILEDSKSIGIYEPVPVKSLSDEKMRVLVVFTYWQHFINSAVVCQFVMSSGRVAYKRTAELVEAATGWNFSVLELIKVGERAANLARAFNVREGFTAADDVLPERCFTPHASGPLKDYALNHAEFDNAKEAYYGISGWPNGIPSKGKLLELDLGWVVSHLPE
ncbi:MAG: aldehyde ferredoxin oxidoreductase family protein [Syntrophales bacterium]|nr:aldehyde ferredoxin oxidoreductase family protein [Syntrophales bacterium]